MLKRINPTYTASWSHLKVHYQDVQFEHMKDLFAKDTSRFEKFSLRHGDILLDYSKNRITQKTLNLLCQLAEEVDLSHGIEQMYTGKMINETEHRSVLHTALRSVSEKPILVDGENIIPEIIAVKEKMKSFCKRFHEGEIKGYSGKPLKHIVNIGIGGSDLGPVMITEALKPYKIEQTTTHFVSNIDSSDIIEVLKDIEPETSLFIIASKSFTTQETMTNAKTALKWFLDNGGSQTTIKDHFVAISTNAKAVKEFGISSERQFGFWDWVGGRFSMSSAIGLSIALTIGYDHFTELLDGLNDMDRHFREQPMEQNMPIIMALIGIWNNNFLGAETEAILPYDQYLHRFPAYFQQGNMESNGKSVDRSGRPISYQTGPIVWGEPGTNGQHAFYQLIHQGTKLIPCDFIATAESHNELGDHHKMLLSNFFAQTKALMIGKTREEIVAEYQAQNVEKEIYEPLLPYKIFEGNKPSNSILIKKLTPFTLGQLVALYEHKIFVQGYIWNIFSFDQWGVELGKQLSKSILPELQDPKVCTNHDSSTNGLIKTFHTMRSE